MSILAFKMPDKVAMEKADDFHGLFEFKLLEKRIRRNHWYMCCVEFSFSVFGRLALSMSVKFPVSVFMNFLLSKV